MNLEEKKDYIMKMDFSMLIKKLSNDKLPHPYQYLWQRQDVLDAVERYRKYLFILVKYQNDYPTIPPTYEIDEIWHNHILETKRYQQDCEALFGHYLHHYPYYGLDNPAHLGVDFKTMHKGFQLTKTLFLVEFQEVLQEPKRDEILEFLGMAP
jgi:hypothetical protein